MAYQAGNYKANTNNTKGLNNLQNSLQKFGGTLNQKEQLENKKKEIDLKNKEEAEYKQAQEIFEGERGKDIYNEHTFATKKGNQKYQELKAADHINNNYQTSLENGTKKGWTTEEILVDFERKNNQVIKDKKYHQDFKNAYVNSTIKYEDKIKGLVNQERVENLNSEFVKENRMSFFNGMITEEQNQTELLSTMKEKTGSKYNNYVSDMINIHTNRGLEISGEYFKEFDNMSKADLNISQALSRNITMAKNKNKETNAKLKDNYEVSKITGKSVDDVDKAFGVYYATLDGNQKENALISHNYYKSSESITEEAALAMTFNDKTAFNEAMNSEEAKIAAFRGGYDLNEMVAQKTMGGIDFSDVKDSDINLIQNYKEMTGVLPKNISNNIKKSLDEGTYEALEKSKNLMKHFGTDMEVRGSLTTEQLALMGFYSRMNESGVSQSDVENILSERKMKILNGTIGTFSKKEKAENRDKIIGSLSNIVDISVDELNNTDQKNYGVISSFVNDIEYIMSSTGASVEEATSIYAPGNSNKGQNFIRNRFLKTTDNFFGDDEYIDRGANTNPAAIDEKLIKDHSFSFIKSNLYSSNGSVNNTEWNVQNKELAEKLANNSLEEEDFKFRSTERTGRDGVLEVVYVDENGLETPIYNLLDGSKLSFATTLFGDIKEDNKKIMAGSKNNLVNEEEIVSGFWNNSLEKMEYDRQFKKSKNKTNDRFIPNQYQELTKTKDQEYSYHSSFKKVDENLNEVLTVDETKKYKSSKNTRAFINNAKKIEDKQYKKEINNEYFADEVQNFNRNIQSAISKGNEYYKDMKYSVKMAVEELKSIDIFGSKEEEEQLKMGDFSVLTEKYKNYGKSKKVQNELNETMANNQQNEYIDYQNYNSIMPYNSKTQEQDQRVLTLMGQDNNAKSEARFNMLADAVSGIESSNGRNLINKKSSATGIYQFMTANGKGKNPFIGSSLDVAIKRVENTFGTIPPELAELQKLGMMSLEGKNVKDPQYKAFRNKFANMPHDLQHIVFVSHLFQENGTNDIMNVLVNGDITEAKQAIAKYYVENHNKDINQLDYNEVIKKVDKIIGDDFV